MTWKYLRASVKGSSHVVNGQPCQDYSSIKLLSPPDEGILEPVLIATAADGAGSASDSRLGARIACTALANQIGYWFREGNTSEAITEQLIQCWFQTIQDTLKGIAQRKALGSSRSLATTLMLSISSSTHSVFAQVGDGAIVYLNNGDYELAFWPQSGEYQNSTYFITDEKALQYLQYKRLDTYVEEFALLTDGLQMLALEYAQKRPFNRFFVPLFETIRKRPPGYVRDLEATLRQFLDSERVNARTDDDKTLVLATRKTSEAAS